MATAIQIAVAAALVMAWVWVLGRPLVKGLLQLLGASGPAPTNRAQSDEDAFWGEPPRFSWFSWAHKPAVVRRRQLLLATVFACFGAFLLAVALRGRFVYLLGLMVAVLALHLGVASYLGGRLVRARDRDRARRKPAGGRSGASGAEVARTTRLRAGMIQGAGPLSRTDELLTRYPLPDLDDGYRSPLAGGEQAVSSLVEQLIELEWGPTDPASELSVETTGAATPAGTDRPAPAIPDHDTSPGVVYPVGPGSGPGGGPHVDPSVPVAVAEGSAESLSPGRRPMADGSDQPGEDHRAVEAEPIFSRPPAQTPIRPRRKARPIYIHSHLDAEGFEPPRAVNHP